MTRTMVNSADCHAGLPAPLTDEDFSREHARGWGKLVYGEG